MRYFRRILILTITLTGSIFLFFSLFLNELIPRLPFYHWSYSAASYEVLLKEIEQKRSYYIKTYQNSRGQKRIKIGAEAQSYFLRTIDESIFPYWYGTRYDFYGTSQIPGEGKIACGYFVTTVLEDMGIALNRSRLAKMPSEDMIKELVKKEYINRFSNTSLEGFIKAIRRSGVGLYITGLDTHTGFTLYDGNTVYFIHASGRYPWCVVKEAAEESRVLRDSKYRVVGKFNF